MMRYALLLVAGVAVLADGYLYGRLSGRWQGSAPPGKPLDELPLAVGDWEGESEQLDRKVVERAGFGEYLSRRYVNRRTGAVVRLLIARGRPGPLSVHTPEVCYGGAGFVLAEPAVRSTPEQAGNAAPGQFWNGTFRRESSPADPKRLRVLWSWNKKGLWTAADNPRWTFAGTPSLGKVYVTQEFYPRGGEADKEPGLEFLREFLPELDKIFAEVR